ncbi:hypothetical protein J1605_008183 [Eschrichtius robustus]|uniref:40S ribosomal protein S2 n=1 Tax=Eschrichtius robustus TaxID=9764 RepID=A0AB34GYK9_ESCRO|nr:hypothetical protein J1605_008183 [Eschrichtius robustus]
MPDDAGAVGGPRGPGGPGMEGRGGFHRGFGSGVQGQGQGCGRGWGRGHGAHGGKAKDKEWLPVTKLGCLVKDMKIKSLEKIYLFSLPIKESEIIDIFLGASLKDEILKIMSVQKQTRAGQRTRFKAFVTIRDYNRHVGLGVKCSKEVAIAICGAIILAKLSIVPVWQVYWGNKIGKPHTVPCKKLLTMAGIDNYYISARGCTDILGNFAKTTFETVFTKSLYQEFIDHLLKTHTRVSVQRTQAPAITTT